LPSRPVARLREGNPDPKALHDLLKDLVRELEPYRKSAPAR